MLGRVRWGEGRKLRLEQERLLELPVLTLELPTRTRGQERRLNRGARLLLEHRVTRVLVPPWFEGWQTLLPARAAAGGHPGAPVRAGPRLGPGGAKGQGGPGGARCAGAVGSAGKL